MKMIYKVGCFLDLFLSVFSIFKLLAFSPLGFDGTCPVQFRPQVWFINSSVCDGNGVDYVGRFEDLNEVIRTVTQEMRKRAVWSQDTSSDIDSKQNIKNATSTDQEMILPHIRASIHPSELPPCFESEAFRRIVFDVYKEDFEFFGYSP